MVIKLDKELIKSVVSLATVIEARDPYTGGHTWRVSQYAIKLAKKAGLSEDEIFIVNLGGLVHDIGKIGISDAILLKPDKLTDEEYAVMKEHPRIGHELIAAHPLFPLLLSSVFEHHERADGRGYPNSVEESRLSVIGKITAIADAFDAMTSTRPYRKGMPAEKALSILAGEKGKQFDEGLVTAFIEMAQEGELDHILGHCGDERLMMACPGCGPIIAPSKETQIGDHIACPSCHGDYVIKRMGEDFEIEFTGNLINVIVPKVDLDTLDDFMEKVPESLDLDKEQGKKEIKSPLNRFWEGLLVKKA